SYTKLFRSVEGSGDLGVVWYQASEVVGQAHKLLNRFLRPWRRKLPHRLSLFFGRQATVIPDFEPEKVDLGEAKCTLLGIDSQVRVGQPLEHFRQVPAVLFHVSRKDDHIVQIDGYER